MNIQPDILIVLGTGSEDKKPRAATFDPKDAATVEAGAAHMGFKIAWAKTAEAQAIAKGLPKGRLYKSGDGFVPLAKVDTYEKLLNLVTVQDPKPGPKPAAAPSTPSAAKPPSASPWDAIEPGATVLWSIDKSEGWFPCIVVSTSKDRTKVTLRWRDYNGIKPFDVKRIAVGLLSKES